MDNQPASATIVRRSAAAGPGIVTLDELADCMTIKDAARFLKLTHQRVGYLVHQGRFGFRVGKGWRILRADVIAYATEPRMAGRPRMKKRRADAMTEGYTDALLRRVRRRKAKLDSLNK